MFEDNKVKYVNLSFLSKFKEQLNAANVEEREEIKHITCFSRIKAKIQGSSEDASVNL